MPKIVTVFEFEHIKWRVVERYDSPSSPYYVIERETKDAMNQPSYEHIINVFPCVLNDVIVDTNSISAFLYLVLKKISGDNKIHARD